MTIQITDARLAGLMERAEAAQGAFEAARGSLYRGDGEPVYGEAEMRERLAELQSQRARACGAAVEEARQIRIAAERAVEDAANSDPLASLPTEDLARASAMRGFAADAAEALDDEGFEKRLRSVLAGGNRAEIGAYYAAGSRRSRRAGSGGHSAPAPPNRQAAAGFADIASRYASSPFDGILEEMRERLDGGRPARAAAEKRNLAEQAARVETKAGHLRTGARNFAQAWANEQRVGPTARR